ncbi:MAG: hypothetical protein ACXW3R_06155 [Rhodoplanes sp.]
MTAGLPSATDAPLQRGELARSAKSELPDAADRVFGCAPSPMANLSLTNGRDKRRRGQVLQVAQGRRDDDRLCEKPSGSVECGALQYVEQLSNLVTLCIKSAIELGA